MKLYLIDDEDGTEKVIDLFNSDKNDRQQMPVKDILYKSIKREITDFIFQDHRYSIRFDASEEVCLDDVILYIDNKKVSYKSIEVDHSNNVIHCWKNNQETHKQWIFGNSYGYTIIYVVIRNKRWASPVLPILVNNMTEYNQEQEQHIRSMQEYVFNNYHLIFEEKGTTISQNRNDKKKKTSELWIDSELTLIKEIVQTYEKSFGFFYTNCRNELQKENQLVPIDKVQGITSQTIQYIVSHPMELQEVKCKNGVRIGDKVYHPQRTMSVQNRFSKNIEENRKVVGFLENVRLALLDLDKDLIKISSKVSELEKTRQNVIEGYQFSNILTVQRIVDDIIEVEKKRVEVQKLKKQVENLQSRYDRIFIRDLKVASRNLEIVHLQPTKIFMEVPEYRKIFTLMEEFFHKWIHQDEMSKFLMAFCYVPDLYEYYALCHLVNCFTDRYGEPKTKTAKMFQQKGVVDNYFTNCNNIFSFKTRFTEDNELQEKEHGVILYYQPIIYTDPGQQHHGIELYRAHLGNKKSNHYNPDYLIKVEMDDDKTVYYILDAKYSNFDTSRDDRMPDVVNKYLTYVRPTNANATNGGVVILYEGKGSEYPQVYNYFDSEGKWDGLPERQLAHIVPISTELDEDKQREILDDLMKLMKLPE